MGCVLDRTAWKVSAIVRPSLLMNGSVTISEAPSIDPNPRFRDEHGFVTSASGAKAPAGGYVTTAEAAEFRIGSGPGPLPPCWDCGPGGAPTGPLGGWGEGRAHGGHRRVLEVWWGGSQVGMGDPEGGR